MIDSQEKVTALYCRYSHEDERSNGDGSNSIKNQLDLLTRYAIEHDFRPFKEYVDDGFRGVFDDRPAFVQMIDDIKAGTIGTVIIKDASRLGRNCAMVGYYTDTVFLEYGIRLILVCDNVDTAVRPDEMGPFRNIFNEYYSKDISTKIRASLHNKARNGKVMISKPIYGYKLNENGEWFIDEYAAGVVKRIFSMYLSGCGTRTIATILTSDGIATPTVYRDGKSGQDSHIKSPEWSDTSIRDMLRRQEYCGDTINFKTERLSYKSKKKIKLPEEKRLVFTDTHPAIISREMFDDTQTMIKKRMKQFGGTRHSPESLFHGFLTCADCKNSMVGSSYKLKSGYGFRYICNTYRRRSTITKCTSHSITEKELVAELSDTLKWIFKMYRTGELAKALKKSIFEEQKQEKELLDKEFNEIKERISEIDCLIKSLYGDKTSGLISGEAFMDIYNQFKVEKSKLEIRYYEILNALNHSNDALEPIARFLKVVDGYAKKRGKLKIDRKTLLDLVDHIEVGEKDKNGAENRHIDIYFKYVGMLQKNRT